MNAATPLGAWGLTWMLRPHLGRGGWHDCCDPTGGVGALCNVPWPGFPWQVALPAAGDADKTRQDIPWPIHAPGGRGGVCGREGQSSTPWLEPHCTMQTSDSYLDLNRTIYVLYGVKYIDLVSLVVEYAGEKVRRLCRLIFPILLPLFRLYEVVPLHVCVLPYKCRKISAMLLKLMKFCGVCGREGPAPLSPNISYFLFPCHKGPHKGIRVALMRAASSYPISLPRFRLYEVVSLHMCVLPYKYRKILEMLLQLMKLCEIMGSRPGRLTRTACTRQVRACLQPHFLLLCGVFSYK